MFVSGTQFPEQEAILGFGGAVVRVWHCRLVGPQWARFWPRCLSGRIGRRKVRAGPHKPPKSHQLSGFLKSVACLLPRAFRARATERPASLLKRSHPPAAVTYQFGSPAARLSAGRRVALFLRWESGSGLVRVLPFKLIQMRSPSPLQWVSIF